MTVEPVVQLSALEHFLYCRRQCALIHVDGMWAENRHTAAGTHAHRRVDSGAHRRERGTTVLRAIPLWSESLGLVGRADAIDINDSGQVTPVEHKSGNPHGRAADVQVCGQAMCLEEMLTTKIPHGYIWYGGSRRRTKVDFDKDLRALTISTIIDVRRTLLASRLPAAPNDKRCAQCQLRQFCLPEVVALGDLQLRSNTKALFTCDI